MSIFLGYTHAAQGPAPPASESPAYHPVSSHLYGMLLNAFASLEWGQTGLGL